MKIISSCRSSLTTLGVATVLSACGAGSNGYPSSEDVKAWHTKTASNGYFKLQTVEITDLDCTTPSRKEMEQLTRAAAFMGSKAEEAIKGAVKCSYTVNASFSGVDKPFLKTQGYEVNGLKLTSQGFMRVPKGDSFEWQEAPAVCRRRRDEPMPVDMGSKNFGDSCKLPRIHTKAARRTCTRVETGTPHIVIDFPFGPRRRGLKRVRLTRLVEVNQRQIMTLRELAHLAQQTLQTHAGCPVKRSHVHELLAAAFGHRSWAAFRAVAVLADAGVGERPSDASPQVIGRAVQLGYHQQAAAEIARSFLVFIAEHQLSSVSWSALGAALASPAVAEGDAQDDNNDDFEEFEEVRSAAPVQPTGAALEQLTRSPMLKSSVEEAAESANPHAHFLLAALYRCRTPNPYLYEESLKGRVLNAAERGWVEDYLRLEPQHRKYEAHLKAAALGGVRAAALEYGTHFERRDFIELAERLTGDVDAFMMARAATTPEARASWLRVAAERGVRSALEELAHQGDAWAEERFAEQGDIHWLRIAAERAVEDGDAMRAWTWQYLALEHRVDLTRSTMAAYHDGGQQDGQFYDSDFGGPMYVDGDEGLALPALRPADHRTAKAEAKLIFRKFS